MAEERRLREMQKVAQEEMEEAHRRETAKKMFQKDDFPYWAFMRVITRNEKN